MEEIDKRIMEVARNAELTAITWRCYSESRKSGRL